MAGTWATLSNAPSNSVATTLLLTDGSVIAQGQSTNAWYKLRPDSNGNYGNGSWSAIASSNNAPLYYASGVLRDGRAIVCGGEYNNGALVWLLAAEIYNPTADTWTALPTPAGWNRIGDAPGCVLPDGRFFLGEVSTRRTAIYDPVANAWAAAANKLSTVGEESWSLLPDGSIHAVDCSNPPNAEKYIIAANAWVNAGATPQVLVDGISEIGASVLLPDGRVFVIGATGFTALYTFPPIADQAGTWAAGPNIPSDSTGQAQGAVDAPAVVLPNGKVLFSVGPITTPASFQAPTAFYEFDPASNTISAAPLPTTSASVPYLGRLMMLPTGQALYTCGSTTVEIYTPDGTIDPVWRPTLTTCPHNLRPGGTFTLAGRQINGLTQCVYYGNDATQATNYPIVRLESIAGSNVVYCRTFDFSTMGLQTGTVIHTCKFTVPSTTPLGGYRLVVIANGIPSEPCTVSVSLKRFKELKFEVKEKFEIKEKFEVKEKIEAKEKLENKEFKEIKERAELKSGAKVEITEKIVREDFTLQHGDADWMQTVRSLAVQVDDVQQQLDRAFIRPEERPDVGAVSAKVEEIRPRKISKAEAAKAQIKLAFTDGRKELAVSGSAAKFREIVHGLSTSGGRSIVATAKGYATKRRSTRKSSASRKRARRR